MYKCMYYVDMTKPHAGYGGPLSPYGCVLWSCERLHMLLPKNLVFFPRNNAFRVKYLHDMACDRTGYQKNIYI